MSDIVPVLTMKVRLPTRANPMTRNQARDQMLQARGLADRAERVYNFVIEDEERRKAADREIESAHG